MAWIESHQDLRTNPKAKRLARILEVPLPQAIGHLHMLWWWALDHAFAGDLDRFDEYDLADAAGWEGPDAKAFVRALIECGSRGARGFIDGELDDPTTWKLHDWHEFTDAMRAKRDSSEKAHHARWHAKREIRASDCRFCDATAPAPVERPQSDRNTSAMPNDADRNAQTGTYRDLPEPGHAREDAEDDPDPPPRLDEQPDDPRTWEEAWGRITDYVQAYAVQDTSKPPLDQVIDPRSYTAFRKAGGLKRLRGNDEHHRIKLDFRDHWRRLKEPAHA